MEENGTTEEQKENHEFMILAEQINSTLDPDQTSKLKQIETLNIFGKHKMFGDEEFIPVGSCVDGSKINLPDDSGDIDVLLVPNKIILKESLFDYDRRYPAFLHIRVNEEHERFFKTVKNPVDGIYLPATVLKQVHESFFFICRIILMFKTSEGVSEDGRFLNVTRTSAVGTELISLNAELLEALGVTDIPFSPSVSQLGQYASKALMGIMNLPYSDSGEANDRGSQNLNSNPQSFVETLNKFLDRAKTQQDDGKTDDRKSNNIPQGRQSTCIDDSSSVAADGYLSTNTQKKDKSSSEKDFSQESLVSTDSITREANKTKISDQTNIKNDNASQDDTILPMTKRRRSVENTESTNKLSPKATKISPEHESTNTKHPFSRLKSTDFVPAYKFKGWPRPAEEWLDRPRKWPAKTVVRQVLERGCHVVAKRPLSMYHDTDSSVTNETDPYFRLSFSESEIILAQNMKERQLLCWRVLKAYQKRFLTSEKKLLTSYHWKNVVFWVSEDVGDSFWKNETVFTGVIQCLDFMIDCLSKKHFPFYFVRQMNLFAGCDENLLEIMKTKVLEIRKQPLNYLKLFINSPTSPEPYMLNISRVKDILSKENKSIQTDTVFEEMTSGLLRQFRAMFESSECDEKMFENHHDVLNKLIAKVRTDEEENSSDALKGISDTENNLKEMFLTRIEMMLDPNMQKENGSEIFKQFAECLETLADSEIVSGDCQEHSDEKQMQVTSDFCSHLASIFLELSKEDSIDDSKVLAGFHNCSKAFVEGNSSEPDDNEDSTELKKAQPTLLAAFPKFIEAIQKSVGKESTDFSLPAELKKIINSTSQEVDAVLGNKMERNKTEMDIDLD